MIGILWLYLINLLFMLIIAIREVRKPAKALFWLVFDLVIPIIGFVLYLSTSNPVPTASQRLTSPLNASDPLPESFSRSASSIAHALRHFAVHGLRISRVQVLTNGIATYERLIASLQNAQKTIDLEYYIYRDDQIGRRITDLLIERAVAGVRVRFNRDGFGSRRFPQPQINRMVAAGIECRTCFPMRFPQVLTSWNYRDHCKIVVIDGIEGFTGGINLGYECTGLKPNVGFWRDTHVRMVGDVAVDLQTIFAAHWNIASPERLKTQRSLNPKTGDPQRHIQSKIALANCSTESSVELSIINGDSIDTLPAAETQPQAYVQTLESNPGIPTQVIREAYFICLTQASRTIDITTPFFVPDADIIMALKTAVARGVRVRLLVPYKMGSTAKIVGPASRTYFGELLEAGVHIYQYNKGILHAKLMVIDGEIAEIGAANFDVRSFRLDYEVCEVIYSTEVALELTEQFERDLADALPLTIADLKQRPLMQRILDQAAHLLSPLL